MKTKRIVCTVFLCLFGSIAYACNIPVFRYALERWRPDVCEVIVFHEGLNQAQEELIQEISKNSINHGGKTNVEVIRSDVRNEKEPTRVSLWDTVRAQPKVVVPYVVIRTTLGTGKTVNHWHGKLEGFSKDRLLDSPVRTELTKRLLKGDSVVWLLLKSKDAEKNQAVRKRLSDSLDRLSKTLELPDGIGLAGSELYSEVPLFLKFSILEIDVDDAREQMLVQLISGFEPDNNDEPLLVPVFGRGRALEVIPAKQLDDGLIGDLTMFLCGACSCQVKEKNPGFDLLLSIDWNQELYGDEANAPPPVASLERSPAKPPELLSIPPGRRK
ncbi:MAG: hypothetical protein ABL921_34055 [Pirellula sp.]